MHAGKRCRQLGLTLIELLVTLAVAIIVVTIAVPGFQHLVLSNREASTEIAIRSGLNLARSEAIKRRSVVSLLVDGDDTLKVQTQSEIFRQINLARQVVLTQPDGSISFNFLGYLTEGSGNKICASFDHGYSLQFELSQAGSLSVQKAGGCNG